MTDPNFWMHTRTNPRYTRLNLGARIASPVGTHGDGGFMTPRPPSGLSRRAATLWRKVTASFDFSDAEYEVLRQALASMDRADSAADAVRKHGVVVRDRFGGIKENPAVAVEAQHRRLFAALMKQLDLRLVGEPDSMTTVRARAAAKVRWAGRR